ncbi:hypothetical protein BGP_0005 [Beggiatoa sp. PS]|nr:hypothetical protein BGP_0005 [Beggiatoa sp. PS]
MIELIEQEGNTVEFRGKIKNGEINILAEMYYERCSLILDDCHIDGPGRGSSSRKELISLARELGKQHNVEKVIIYGWTRASGANIGKKPIPITIKVWRKIEKYLMNKEEHSNDKNHFL